MLGLSISQLVLSLLCHLTTCLPGRKLSSVSMRQQQEGAAGISPDPPKGGVLAVDSSPHSFRASIDTVGCNIPCDTIAPPILRGELDLGATESINARGDSFNCPSPVSLSTFRDRSESPTHNVGSEKGGSVEGGEEEENMVSIQERIERLLWPIVFSCLTIAIWVLVIVDTYSSIYGSKKGQPYLQVYIDVQMLRSVALAPFGAWLRYSLWHVPTVTRYFTSQQPHMMVPTLGANAVGTLLFSAAVTWDSDLYSSAFTQGYCTRWPVCAMTASPSLLPPFL